MAAAKKPNKKRGKSSFLCFFGGCFGISNKVSADHGDGKSIKKVTDHSGRRGGSLPVKITPPSPEVVKSTKEVVHVVRDEEKRLIHVAPLEDELISNKVHNISSVGRRSKSKDKSNPTASPTKRVEKQNSTVVQEIQQTNILTKLSHSTSLPSSQMMREKPSAIREEKGKKGRDQIKPGGELDPIVGAVIISITLIVMLIWGKVCATLCTAAWFYYIPRFRANFVEYHAIKLDGDHVDLDSREYKKKVVLQGLLHRN